MQKHSWQIPEPFHAVIFDCDGTLTAIEGIDYLASINGVYEEVAALTEKAMAETGLTADLYEKRLQLVKPTHANIIQLGKMYCQEVLPDVMSVIQLFQSLNKSIYILSAGLKPAVITLAEYLSIPTANVHAVDIYFNQQQTFKDFDRASPLIHNTGKVEFVKQIRKQHERILYVGDGLNDIAVKKFVSRFVGFGGVFYRENMAQMSDFYIKDYAALLPLAITETEKKQFYTSVMMLYEKGLNALKE